MKAQGKVKGILLEGSDGYEYLLGFGSAEATTSPTLSRRQADGTFEPFGDVLDASRVGGQAPAPGYCMSLPEDQRAALRERIRTRLPVRADGTIHLSARAWAAKSRVG